MMNCVDAVIVNIKANNKGNSRSDIQNFGFITANNVMKKNRAINNFVIKE